MESTQHMCIVSLISKCDKTKISIIEKFQKLTLFVSNWSFFYTQTFTRKIQQISLNSWFIYHKEHNKTKYDVNCFFFFRENY